MSWNWRLVLLLAFFVSKGAFAENRNTTNECVKLFYTESEMKRLEDVSKKFSKDVSSTGDPKGTANFQALHQLAIHMEVKKTLQELKAFMHPALEKSSMMTYYSTGSSKSTDYKTLPSDCADLLVAGYKENGVYDIYPFRCVCTKPVSVFCDMETDGGGWTVFLHRDNASKHINFYRNWRSYKDGFGSPLQEYWLGNEYLHALTFSRVYLLRLEARDAFEREIWGEWNQFSVDSEENKYKILVSQQNVKSTAYDRFTHYSNSMFFSTFDNENDRTHLHCPEVCKGGWWYNDCATNNPTGIHGKQDAEGLRVHPWSKTDGTVRYATWLQLKIRPVICSTTISTTLLNAYRCG